MSVSAEMHVDAESFKEFSEKLKQKNYTEIKELKRNYKLNGETVNLISVNAEMEQQQDILNIRNEYITQKRDNNLRTLATFLNDEKNKNIVLDASDNHRTSVVIDITAKELLHLIMQAHTLINAIDISDPSEFSSDPVVIEGTDNLRAYAMGVSLLQMWAEWGQYNYTTGLGVGIYMSDAQCPADKYDIYEGYTSTSGLYDNYNTPTDPHVSEYFFHTKTILGILGSFAPKSNIYCRSAAKVQNALPLSTSGINIETYSRNSISDRYTSLDALFDNHVYTKRNVSVVVSSGNKVAEKVLSPAKAFNVISVGAYAREELATPQIMWKENADKGSSYLDPLLPNGFNTIAKPEVIAPGVDFYAGPVYGLDSGTSYAAPFVAALIADAISSKGDQWKYGSAAMMKAVVIAGASDPVSGTYNEHGEGAVDFYTMSKWLITNNATWASGKNSDHAGCSIPWKITLFDGFDQRIVVSWLNYIDNFATMTEIPNEFTLELLNSNAQSIGVKADKHNQGYQIIKTKQPAGDYYLKICGVRTDNKDFVLGLATSHRPDASTSKAWDWKQ